MSWWRRKPPVYDRHEFSVCQFFVDKTHRYFVRRVDARTAFHHAERLTQSIGARIGTTERVIVTDGGDFTIFEWTFGRGITFPPGTVFPPREDGGTQQP